MVKCAMLWLTPTNGFLCFSANAQAISLPTFRMDVVSPGPRENAMTSMSSIVNLASVNAL